MQGELSRTALDGLAARDEYDDQRLGAALRRQPPHVALLRGQGVCCIRGGRGPPRFYNPSDRIRLELILKGKRLGFTLSEISQLIASNEKRSAAREASPETADLTVSLDRHQIQAQIAYLERQRDELDSAIAELREARARMMSDALD